MKNLKQFLGLAIMALVVFSSCQKEETQSTTQPEITPELFQTASLDELAELLDLDVVSLEDASSNQEVDERTDCCDVDDSSIIKDSGSNTFDFSMKYPNNAKYIVTVWQGNHFQMGSVINLPLHNCTGYYEYTNNVENFATIVSEQQYTLKIFLYKSTGPFCDLGQHTFIGS